MPTTLPPRGPSRRPPRARSHRPSPHRELHGPPLPRVLPPGLRPSRRVEQPSADPGQPSAPYLLNNGLSLVSPPTPPPDPGPPPPSTTGPRHTPAHRPLASFGLGGPAEHPSRRQPAVKALQPTPSPSVSTTAPSTATASSSVPPSPPHMMASPPHDAPPPFFLLKNRNRSQSNLPSYSDVLRLELQLQEITSIKQHTPKLDMSATSCGSQSQRTPMKGEGWKARTLILIWTSPRGVCG